MWGPSNPAPLNRNTILEGRIKYISFENAGLGFAEED